MNEITTRRMKLSQIQALIAVADCENFSEAALQLELSQSAVSHAIASLETELECNCSTGGDTVLN